MSHALFKAKLEEYCDFEIVTSYCPLRSSIYHFHPPLPRLFKNLNLFLPSGFKMASFHVGLSQTFVLRYAYKIALGQSSSQLSQLLRRSQISHVPARILHSVGNRPPSPSHLSFTRHHARTHDQIYLSRGVIMEPVMSSPFWS